MNRLDEYRKFIGSKKERFNGDGITSGIKLSDNLFHYQRDCVEFALNKGRSGLFLDTGLGKSICSFDWASNVIAFTNKPVLMLSPLGVAFQHKKEAERFGYEAIVTRDGQFNSSFKGIAICNYEMLHKLDLSVYGGVILDESSILKSFTGKTKNQLINAFSGYRFKLAATATPSPNDLMELGNHSAFLDVMRSREMLARWFITDQSTMGKYRLKKPAIKDYWEWVASWSRALSKPSDLGYSDEGFILPALNEYNVIVESDISQNTGQEKDGQLRLLRVPDTSATAIHGEKRLSMTLRAQKTASIVNDSKEFFTIWCDTDYDADELKRHIPDAIEVRGSMPLEKKESLLSQFSNGESRVLITKPKVAGYGLNWQHCNNTVFNGLSFSYENYYQALRRHYRFGQKKEVNSYVVQSDTETQIMSIITRKKNDHETLKKEMQSAMKRAAKVSTVLVDYEPKIQTKLPTFI